MEAENVPPGLVHEIRVELMESLITKSLSTPLQPGIKTIVPGQVVESD